VAPLHPSSMQSRVFEGGQSQFLNAKPRAMTIPMPTALNLEPTSYPFELSFTILVSVAKLAWTTT
jgi:hypothetical protein